MGLVAWRLLLVQLRLHGWKKDRAASLGDAALVGIYTIGCQETRTDDVRGGSSESAG